MRFEEPLDHRNGWSNYYDETWRDSSEWALFPGWSTVRSPQAPLGGLGGLGDLGSCAPCDGEKKQSAMLHLAGGVILGAALYAALKGRK